MTKQEQIAELNRRLQILKNHGMWKSACRVLEEIAELSALPIEKEVGHEG